MARLGGAVLLLALAAAARAGTLTDLQRAFALNDAVRRVAALQQARAGIGALSDAGKKRAVALVRRGIFKEPSPDVRAAALDFLFALHTDRSLSLMLVGAIDPDPGVRGHLDSIVSDHPGGRLLRAIARTRKEDASWRYRVAMVDLLLADGRSGAKSALVEALSDPQPAVAARAAEALERLTGRPLGLDAAAWRKYFAAEAEEAARKARARGETKTVAGPRKRPPLYTGPIRGLHPTFYTIPVREKQVVFVIDMSSSLRKGDRSLQLRALLKTIFELPSDTAFNILCFDQRMFFFEKAKSLAKATTEAKERAEKWVDTLPAGQRTDLGRSVASGLAMLHVALDKDPQSRAELFLLTDGVETVHTFSGAAVQRQFDKLPEKRCRINVVLLGHQGTPALRVLAERTGGAYVETPAR